MTEPIKESVVVVPDEVTNPEPVENNPLPLNMKATMGWVLYKFATEGNVEHLKQLALYMAEEIGKTLPKDQEQIDKLITSFLEEHGA